MFSSQEGRSVPQVTFHTHQGDQWVEVTSDELFLDQRVIVFSLPGAFTPTCSSSHLPRYNELAPIFQQYGIDRILCVSVNDAFVMEAWKEAQKAEHVTFLPDGEGHFTRGMNMMVEKSEQSFGPRAWRYSMLVCDGVIEKMFIEPDTLDDPFQVSDADTMLNYLAPEHQLQPSIALFTKPDCPYCAKAKQLLRDRGLQYEEISLGRDATLVSLRAVTGRATVPQVFIGGRHIGGSDDLEHYLQ